ncbi:MAG: YhdP family protein [Candidatus Thiodiazotropha sp.]
MLHVARYLHGKFWLVMAWLTIALALLLTGVRLFLPLLDLGPYKQEIERIVEAEAGKPLSIGRMQAELHGFRLALKFTNVSLFDSEGSPPLVEAREVRVDIELLSSLLSGELKLGGGVVVGTQLLIERHEDGSFSLQGLTAGGGDNSNALAGVLLGRSHLRLHDSEILLKSSHPGTPLLELTGVAVDLINDDEHHSFSVKAKIGRRGEEVVRFIVDLQEGEKHSMAVDGSFYLKCDNLRLGKRLAEWMPAGYSIHRGTLGVELWGDLQRGQVERLRGTTELDDVEVSGPAIETPFQLERLASQVDWQREKGGWRVDLDRLVLVRAGQLWPPGRLSLAWRSDEERGRLFRMGADYLSLKELNDFLAIIKLPNQELGDALRGLSADGHLTKFGFSLLQLPQGEPQWHVGGVVARYSNKPWRSVPGLSGLRLSFEGNQVGGWLRLDSSDFSVKFPKLFRQSINARRLAGDFQWRFDTQSGLHLNTDRLEMRNDDVETLSRIRLNVPLSGTGLFVDMQSDFWNGDGSRKSDYLPVGIMPDALVHWLDRSVVSGHVNAGSFLLYGPLKKFPFHEQEGRFEVWFGVEDLVLDYHQGWPPIEQGTAEAFFVNNSLQVTLQDGMLLGNRLQNAHARIRELKGAAPVEIDGEISGSFREMLALLSETPLKERFAPFVDAVEVEGEAVTQISLAIPLKKKDSLKVDGKLSLLGADMLIKLADLNVKDIRGDLSFDEKQVSANKLKAELMGHPVTVDITPRLTKHGRWTRISTSLGVTPQEISQQFPGWWLPPMQGEAEGKVTLDIAHHSSRVPVRLRAVSNLRGLSVNLPEPMRKRRSSNRKMDLTVDFRSDHKTDLHLHYGKQVNALVRVPAGTQDPLMAGIAFSRDPELPKSGRGYRFIGSLDKLNGDQWLAWLGSNAGESSGPTPIEVDLKVRRLKIAGIESADTDFTVRNFADGYRVELESEAAKGMIQVPGDLQNLPLLGRFDYIKLKLDELSGVISGTGKDSDAPVDFDPRDLPALDMSVDALYLSDQNLGKSRLAWQKEKDGITISQVSVVGAKLDLSGQGYWRLTNKGHLTSLNLKGHIVSLGELQDELGMSSGMKDAPADIKAELYWPVSPLMIGADKLYGSIWLKVGKGQVKDVDPGVGRLIGLFSLNALGKRLALDFRDFFSEGLSFDGIEGNFTIHDGVATTQDLTMRSSSARIEFSGDTGLVTRTYDQKVVVTPHLSATLPVVGALAVNPTVGVALALTQKLLGKRFDKVVQRTYEVTGSWDAPEFKQIGKVPVSNDTREADMGIDLPGRP